MMYDRWLEEPYQNEDKESDAFWEWVSGEYELLHGSFSDDNAIYLSNAGFIVKIKDELYIYNDAVADIKNRLVEFIESSGEISTPQFKEMTGASRKYVIPLLEYFDSQNVTIRIGDIRKLRK